MATEIPPEIGLDEADLKESLETILSHHYKEKTEVDFEGSISLIKSMRSRELDLKRGESEVYIAPILALSNNLEEKKLIISRGGKTRKVYREEMFKPYASKPKLKIGIPIPPEYRNLGNVIIASNKKIALKIAGLKPDRYTFAKTSEEISILSEYYTNPEINTKLEEKGFVVHKPVLTDNIVDKIAKKDPEEGLTVYDLDDAFNPPVLLHGRLTHDASARFKKEKLLKIPTESEHTERILENTVNFYEKISGSHLDILKHNFRLLVSKNYMPQIMQAIIHNSTPYDNRIVSFVNQSNFTFGPVSKDLTFITWPEIFKRFRNKYVMVNLLIDNYLWKLDKHRQEIKGDNKKLPKSNNLEESVYLAGLDRNLEEAQNLHINRHDWDNTMKEQWQILASKNPASGKIYNILKSYKPKIVIPSDIKYKKEE